MALFVIVGSPLVAYVWETLNLLVAGRADAGRLLITLPIAALLAGVLMLLARAISRWEGERQENIVAQGVEAPPRRMP
jgi:hypothetical protein